MGSLPVLLLLILVACGGGEVKITVQQLPPIFPDQKNGGGAFYDGERDQVYFLGGYDTGRRSIYRFDPKTWNGEVLDATVPVHSWGAYGWTGQVFYIAGGSTSDEGENSEGFPTDKIYRFDPRLGTVSVVGRLPDTIYDGVGVWNSDQQALYILGGYYGGSGPEGDGGVYENDVLVFTPADGEVKKSGYYSDSTDNSAAVYNPDSGLIYKIGGHAQGTFMLSIIEVPPDGQTRIASFLPVALDLMAAFYHKNYIYIIGGRNKTFSDGVDTIYRFDPAKGSVTLLDVRLPRPTQVSSYASSQDTVYILTPGPPMAIKFE